MNQQPEPPQTEEPPALEDEPSVPPAERTWPKPWMGPFLRSLSMIPSVAAAERVSGVSHKTVYRYRNSLPDFADAWDEALELARDFVERTAHTWITTGVPVKSKRTVTKKKTAADGSVVETTTEVVETESAERSSTLMIFWLKANYPDKYRWIERAEVGGADGGPIRVEGVESIDAQIAKLSAEQQRRAVAAGSPPVPDEETRELAEPVDG